ncbi:MAG: cohesin domain-containing protein [Dehalococcoidia bacterium]|nr:cohesin domain-containing protein [Dehalococcoidia bacterium]
MKLALLGVAGAAALLVMSLAPGYAPSATEAQAPTSVSVDVVPAGNTAASVGTIQACASAQKGDSFIVNIVISDVKDLLASELAVSYNPDVLEVTGRDVEQFQAASAGSQILDLSGKVPDDDGRYEIQFVDTADPLAPENGSGILATLTLRAKGDGASPISIAPVDLNGDGKPDRGILLRNAAGDAIGDTSGDSLFDGPAKDAEVRVGESCSGADAGNLVQTVAGDSSVPGQTGGSGANSSDGGTDTTLIAVVAVAVLAAVAVLILVAVLLRRRGATGH